MLRNDEKKSDSLFSSNDVARLFQYPLENYKRHYKKNIQQKYGVFTLDLSLQEIYGVYLGKHHLLGFGDFGKIKLAWHVVTNERYALKIQNTYPEVEHSIMRELGLISNTNKIVTHQRKDGSINYQFIMPFIPGKSLFAWLDQGYIFAPNRRLKSCLSMLRYVYKLHDVHHIFHRDIKTDNIMFNPGKSANEDKIYFIDYGLSKKITEEKEIIIEKRNDINGLGRVFKDWLFFSTVSLDPNIGEVVESMCSENPPPLTGEQGLIARFSIFSQRVEEKLAPATQKRFREEVENNKKILEELLANPSYEASHQEIKEALVNIKNYFYASRTIEEENFQSFMSYVNNLKIKWDMRAINITPANR